MKNELWTLLDSMEIYEISKFTYGDLRLSAIVTLATIAAVVASGALLYTALDESSFVKKVLGTLCLVLAMVGGSLGIGAVGSMYVNTQLTISAKSEMPEELSYYFTIRSCDRYDLCLTPKEDYSETVYQWWESKGRPAHWKPLADNTTDSDNTWTCECGQANSGNYCGACGKPRPDSTWTCDCGHKNELNFCEACGQRKDNYGQP